jgi:2-oxo-4-hydroxy-4-carboxy--5-ureidoimidazoline (OHCU) decarboxylase
MGGITHYSGTKEYKAQGLDFVSTEELELFINVANDYNDFFVSVWNVIY